MKFFVTSFLSTPTFFSTYELPQEPSNCKLFIDWTLYNDMEIKKFLAEHPYFCISCSYSNVSNRIFFKLRPCLETTLYELIGQENCITIEKSPEGPYFNIHFPYLSKIPQVEKLNGALHLVKDTDEKPYILVEMKF